MATAKRSPEYRPDLYGQSFADVYDAWYGRVSDAEACAEFVAQRCKAGPVLEVGVGSGRLAFPLTRCGVETVGLDASDLMLRQARKAADPKLTLALADMRQPPFRPSSFRGILVGFNTFFNVTSDSEQQQLFVDLAALLTSDGFLVLEASNSLASEEQDPGARSAEVPLHSFGADRKVDDSLVVTSTNVYPFQQRVDGCHIQVDDAAVVFRPWHLRWATPSQLDSYAKNAGLERTEQYADWNLTPFSCQSASHISVFRRR